MAVETVWKNERMVQLLKKPGQFGRRKRYECIQFPARKHQETTETNDFWRILGLLGVVFGILQWVASAKPQKKKFWTF